ncbi:MAG: hypothetical protein AMS18_12140 [Gemmatimonas sp. SG8_17]|nr:MAG: hypothetical protein AMS18_12140 [Gemmatimonas sp. SG8_17]
MGFFGLELSNTGTLDLDSQAGGILALTGQFTHASTGILQGNGTLDLTTTDVVAFDGQVNPGTSPGILNFAGDALMSPLTTANIELGGLNAGTEYDQVNINGAISLDGTVNLHLINGFIPTVGNVFTVLTFTSRSGNFANITGRDLGSGLRLDTVWTATSLELEVVQPAPAQILFAGDSAGGLSTGVFTVNPDGSGLTHPYSSTTIGYQEVYPRWSPNRERIAFTNRKGFTPPNPNELYMVHASGDTLVTLVSDTSTFIPRWSPNGAHLAFECGNGWDVIDICAIGDVTGPLTSLSGIGNASGKVYLTDFDVVHWGGGSWVFAWDPLNPDRIAVVRDSLPPLGGQGQSMIFTMLYDGSGVQRLLPTGVLDAGNGPLLINENMDWSSDGQWLVFAAVDPQGQMNIYKIDRNGANLTQLTATPDQDGRPVWSPNGAEILFGRNLESGGYCDYDAWIMNSDGSNAHQITNEQVCDWNLETLAGDWSPDGQQIALTGFDLPYGNLSIYVVPRTVTAATYFAQRMLIGRTGSVVGMREVTDIQPSWRP